MTDPLSKPVDPGCVATGVAEALRSELMKGSPFAQMPAALVDRWIEVSHLVYFAPGEVLLSPAHGPVRELLWIRRGGVRGQRGLADLTGGFGYEAGDCFPVGALLGERPVTATYTASEDCFCLATPADAVRSLAAQSAALSDFLNSRVQQFLALSQRQLQSTWASQALQEQSLETPLATLPRRSPLVVPSGTPLSEALQAMHKRRIGSVLVGPAADGLTGILTRHDVLDRVTLAGVSLQAPVDSVMSRPVRTLTEDRTALDAALVMARHGIRHLPIVDREGRLVNIVSERDLFAMQRLSLQHLGAGLRSAPDLPALVALAADIRRLAAQLLGQGVRAAQLTAIVSHLNDTLTERWVTLVAARHGLDLSRACWLAFGSEGRGEQTVATDQDNGLVFLPPEPVDPQAAPEASLEAERARWLAMALEVNQGLADCGYPLCRGGVMASNAACCATPAEWSARFSHWMAHGAPADLLQASIFFDLRPVAGATALAEPLREQIAREAAALPRFMKQMADNTLRTRIPLNWRGGIEAQVIEGRDAIDLKLQGSALFVDVARLYALARGIPATGTAQRLNEAGRALGVAVHEYEAWVTAFEFLQMLRLQVQLPATPGAALPASPAGPNMLFLERLNDIDRRMLRESLRVARRLHQRVALDYGHG